MFSVEVIFAVAMKRHQSSWARHWHQLVMEHLVALQPMYNSFEWTLIKLASLWIQLLLTLRTIQSIHFTDTTIVHVRLLVDTQ